MAEDKNETHYFLDGNPDELERLRLGQEVIKNCMGKLVFPPIDFNQPSLRLLDSATADGTQISRFCLCNCTPAKQAKRCLASTRPQLRSLANSRNAQIHWNRYHRHLFSSTAARGYHVDGAIHDAAMAKRMGLKF